MKLFLDSRIFENVALERKDEKLVKELSKFDIAYIKIKEVEVFGK